MNQRKELNNLIMIVLDKFNMPQDQTQLALNIVSTGSQGNSVLLEPFYVLFDIGLPFNHYDANFFYQVDYLLLTHKHGDHLNLATLTRIIDVYPNVKVIAPSFLKESIPAELHSRINWINVDEPMILSLRDDHQLLIKAIKTKHGQVNNVLYDLSYDNLTNYHVLYATDLETISYQPKDDFDLMLLEANYEKRLLPTDPTIFVGNYRHLSNEQAKNYATKYLRDKHSFWIPLHASKDYGTYLQE